MDEQQKSAGTRREVPLQLKSWEGEQHIHLQLNEKRIRRMIWATRFRVARSVIATGVMVLFFYLLYMAAVNIVFVKSDYNYKFARYLITMANTHEQGLRIRSAPNVEVNGLLTQNMKLNLYRKVGQWDIKEGELTGKKHIFGPYTYRTDVESKYWQGSPSFSYAVPGGLLKGGPDSEMNRTDSADTWNQIAHIGDGFVAEMGFSLMRGMQPEELMTMLDKYDLTLLSMPVYAGEIREFKPNFSSSSGNLIQVQHLTLQPRVLFNENHSLSGWSTGLGAGNIEEAKQGLLEDMEWLLSEGSYNGSETDELRLII